MKKIIFALSILLSTPIFSQVKFGLKLAPNVSLTSVRSDTAWASNSASIRYIGGLFADISLTDNAAINIGLEYAPKRIGLKFNDIKSSYNLQYVQLPVGLKFFTNEFADRFKIYFLFAPNLALKIAERSSDKNEKYIAADKNYKIDLVKYAKGEGRDAFNLFDVGLNFGAGTEIRVGESTHLFGGLSYSRGLVNAINVRLKDQGAQSIDDQARVITGLINLDLGIKF